MSSFHFPNTPFYIFSLLACLFFLLQTRGFLVFLFPRVFLSSVRHAFSSFSLFRVLFTLLEDTQIFTFPTFACRWFLAPTRRFLYTPFLRVENLFLRHVNYLNTLFSVSICSLIDTKISGLFDSSCLSILLQTRKFSQLSFLRVYPSFCRHENSPNCHFFVSTYSFFDTKIPAFFNSSCLSSLLQTRKFQHLLILRVCS